MVLLICLLPLPVLAEEPVGEPEVLPAPTAPTGLISTNVTQTSIDLSWHENPVEEEVSSYHVYIDGVYMTSRSSATYSVSDLETDTEYQFYVSAMNSSGEGPASNVLVVNTRLPQEPPYNLSATNISATSIGIAWEGSAPSYEVYIDDGEGAALIVQTSGTTYTITELQPEHQYGIYVVALYDDGPSEPSNTLNITTGAIQAPYNLRVTNIGSTSVVFTWDGSAPSYEIYLDEGEESQFIGTTAGTSYTVTGLEPEQQYGIYVVSIYDDGPSEPSNTLNVTLGAIPVPTSVEGIVTASFPYIRMLTPFLVIAFAIGATFLIIERLPALVGRRRYW